MNLMAQITVSQRMNFTPDMATGIRVIDNDHRMLIDIANSLADEVAGDASIEKRGAALEALVRYVEEHFRREEKMMTDCAYAELANHMREHQKLSRSVYDLCALYRTHPDQVPWPQVVVFVMDWLKTHILKTDMAYVPCVRNFDGTKKCAGAASIQPVTVHVVPRQIDLLFRCSNLLMEDGDAARMLEEAVAKIEQIPNP
jgi:hemerythrin-like metal-binding protein